MSTSLRKCAIYFAKRGVGGSKAVWKSCKTSPVLVGENVPKSAVQVRWKFFFDPDHLIYCPCRSVGSAMASGTAVTAAMRRTATEGHVTPSTSLHAIPECASQPGRNHVIL